MLNFTTSPNMTKEERRELFLKALFTLHLENPVADIHDKTGYDKGNISKILNNKLYPSKGFIQLFEKAYNLNIEDFDNVLQPEKQLKPEKKDHENAIWVDYNRFMMVPLVGQRAQAGFLSGWGDPEYMEDLPKVPWEVDREYKGKYVCFEVSGDSMDDGTSNAIIEGDILLCREIQRVHWKNKLHTHTWDFFVVVHRTEGVLVKEIDRHDTDNGNLLLHSLNDLYDDIKVNMNDLVAIFNVVNIHRKPRKR